MSERKIIFLIGAVQCINILDFMMVMPLGPDFGKALAISAADLGWISGAYGAAAAVAGLLASCWLDRFDRKRALLLTLGGLFLATLLGALASDFKSLLVTRLLAGAFGGPASAVSYAIIADIIPIERRGQALGKVMGAFSVASVLGVPFGLELARLFGWQAPFIAISLLGIIVMKMAHLWLPSLQDHIGHHPPLTFKSMVKVWRRHKYVLAFLTNGFAMAAGFMIIPNIASYLQFNLHYPREHLGILYMAGGTVSFFVLRFAGRAIDRLGGFGVNFLGTAAIVLVIIGGFAMVPPWFHPIIVFMLFMFGMSLRNVSIHTMSSRVPAPHERAGFMSMMSATTHIASATGAFIASKLLTVASDGQALEHMDYVAYVAAGFSVAVPFLLRTVERLSK